MKKNYSTFRFAKTLVAIAALVLGSAQAFAQACVGSVNVTLGAAPGCTYTILPADVSASPGTVEISRNGGVSWVAATVTASDLGRTLQYRLTSSVVGEGICWGNVTVEDKTAPVISPATNVTLNCDDRNMLAAGSTGSTGPTAITAPTVADCSGVTRSSADEVLFNKTCPDATATGSSAVVTAQGITFPAGATAANTIKIVKRTYAAKDQYNNIATPVVQYIFIVRNAPGVPASYTTAVNVLCPAEPAAATTVPAVLACGITISFQNDLRVNLCGNTYKLVRTWLVTDQCGAGTMATTATQIITVIDNVAPKLEVSGLSYDLADVTAYSVCTGTVPPAKKVQATLKRSASGALTVTAWGDSRMCGAGSISLNAVSSDSCSNGAAIAVNDTRFTVSASGVITNNTPIMGNTSFDVTSTDLCGNQSKVTVTVLVVDNISPTAICDGVTATLNNYREARITGASFNHSSNDNCGIIRILVAKNVNGSVPTSWCDDVTYGCSDLNSTTLKVWVRYVDAAGNFTDCCVPVTIVDKATIACAVTTIPVIPCNDPSLINVGSLFVPPTTFYDGCTNPVTPVITNASTTPGCGVNTFTRTWTYTITNSLGSQTTACSQTITTRAVPGFRVTPLDNPDLTCSGNVSTAEADRLLLVANLKLQHDSIYAVYTTTAGVTTLNAGTGVRGATYLTCAAPVVDVTESVYSNAEFCKVIVRTFVIKDLCNFSTINSSITNGSAFVPVGGDLQSVTDAQGRHYIIYTRTIRIRDNVPPVGSHTPVADVCITTTGNCTFSFSTTLSGTDGCSTAPASSLFYSWRIVTGTTPSGVVVRTSTGSSVTSPVLAAGTYTVYYRVSDFCGNISEERSFTVTGRDCKAPEILVHDKVLALAGVPSPLPNTPVMGMGTVKYADIRNRITDNCDGDLTNKKVVMELVLPGEAARPTAPRNVNAPDSVLFRCTATTISGAAVGGVGVNTVRVWSRDTSNNWNFAISTIDVQDNAGVCTVRALIAGVVGTENNAPVKDVVISANANGIVSGSNTSIGDGTYAVSNLNVNTNYQVRAAKTVDTDKKNGVTTLDIALISKHNLGIEALNSPYKIIAADVNKDGEVDATDMLHIRRFILNITPTLPAGSAWRFLDKSYVFRNAANPLGEDFSEVVNLSSVPAGQSAANFTAVKLGDVNNSFDASLVRGSRALVFNANDMDVVAGNEYTVAINAENFNAAAFQGTFAFEGASVKAVKAGSLNNASDANFGMFNNAVTTSWNGKSEASADVVNITFVATKSGKLSDMLTVNSSVTMAEGYDAAGNPMNVSLKFNTGKVAGGEFALYANTPNPFSTSTTIGFNLPKDGQAKLTVYTASGKVLFVKNDNFKAGVNQVTVNKADLNASGLVYYRLDTQDNSSTRKMIIIE